jgi:glycosyltransferase involved in cell wall biosynthesis
MKPLVSVLMPAYNAGIYLAPAVRSVLEQSHDNLELIIIDDGSTDGAVDALKQILTDSRIRWIRQDNMGKPVAMNRALQLAQGAFYALQDADDLSHPLRIEKLVAALQQRPECAAVFSGHELILEGQRIAPTFRAKTPSQCQRDIDRILMPAHDPTAMYRMSMVKGIEYEPRLRLGEGLDYILRVGEQNPMLVVGECLYSYRVHQTSLTKSDPALRDRLVQEVQRRACERRGIEFDKWLASRNPQRLRSKHSYNDNGVASHFALSVQDQRNLGLLLPALSTGLKCFRLHPFEFQYLKPLIYSVSPNWLRSRVKSYQS